MIVRDYCDDDYKGVIECLKRNYDVFDEMTPEYMKEWTAPMLSNWRNDNNFGDRHGVVIENDGAIYGFLGAFYSVRTDGNEKCVVLHPTTWAIDKEYRFYLIQAMKVLFMDVDLIVDATPNPAMVKIYTNIFKFQIFEKECLLIPPVPYNGVKNIDLQIVYSIDVIEDSVIKQEYIDHQRFQNIKLAIVSKKNGDFCYIFYKLKNENGKWFRILKVTERDMFTCFCHEIIWNIFCKEIYGENKNDTEYFVDILKRAQNSEYISAECDAFIFGNNMVQYPYIKKKNVVRLKKMKKKAELLDVDYMYSELALLL